MVGITIAWIVGLLLTVFAGHVPVQLFRDRLWLYVGITDADKPKCEGLKSVPAWLTGGMERLFFAVMVAVQAPAWPAAMMTWLLVKLATNWNFAGRPNNAERDFLLARTFGFVALLSGLLSLLIAFCGGVFIQWLSGRLQ